MYRILLGEFSQSYSPKISLLDDSCATGFVPGRSTKDEHFMFSFTTFRDYSFIAFRYLVYESLVDVATIPSLSTSADATGADSESGGFLYKASEDGSLFFSILVDQGVVLSFAPSGRDVLSWSRSFSYQVSSCDSAESSVVRSVYFPFSCDSGGSSE